MPGQLKMMNRMGSLTTLMSMIPGAAGLVEQLSALADPALKLKRYMLIMGSMTAYELDHDDRLFFKEPRRIARVAWGAGAMVEELLSKFEPFNALSINTEIIKLLPFSLLTMLVRVDAGCAVETEL